MWDNVPVNDGLMADRLHLGPLWGRDRHLVDDSVVTGWLANPMVQPMASLLPLASIAAFGALWVLKFFVFNRFMFGVDDAPS